jgi:hypothetical protein
MVGNEFVVALFAGVVLAVPYLVYARSRRWTLGAGLIVAAAVYVPFAVLAGTLNDVLTELSGVVLFGVLAAIGMRGSLYFLALGWVAHLGWDLLLHPMHTATYAPWWYPIACIGFDLVVGGAIVGIALAERR